MMWHWLFRAKFDLRDSRERAAAGGTQMNINYLAQPQTSVSHGLTIFVTVPRQREQFLQRLDNLGLNIGLLLFREGEEAVAYESDAARIPMPYKTTEGK